MSKVRQDAWTDEEDMKLVEIVLSYIRNGRTQLEAFKHAGNMLSRTAAACGFRWNATLRKKYGAEIVQAKSDQKDVINSIPQLAIESTNHTSFESVISILEKMKDHVALKETESQIKKERILTDLQRENEELKIKMKRYEEAWSEMHKLWDWIDGQHE